MRIGESSRTCAICYEGFVKEEVVIQLPCGHFYHRSCCKNWVLQKASCPICRDNLDAYFETDIENSACNEDSNSYDEA